MEQEVINKLVKVFGPVKWSKKSILGMRNEGWFLLKTIPLPPIDELPNVISDIMNGYAVDFANGKVRHYKNCKNPNHTILDYRVKSILDQLPEQSFKVAICTGSTDCLMGQPIAIALEPTINYMIFPDHPHLNMGNKLIKGYFPDSFCYGFIVEQERYGPTEYDRYINTFDEVTLWLLRHLVWVATRNKYGKGIWIGPAEGQLEPSIYGHMLNPLGRCRCGKNKRYRDCHLRTDIKIEVEQKAKQLGLSKELVLQNLINGLVNSWNHNILLSQNKMLKYISEKLI
jgi:hypothetical protein